MLHMISEYFIREFSSWDTAIPHIFGYIGIICAFVSFFSKKYQVIMWFRLVNEFMFGVQYVLIGLNGGNPAVYTAAAMNGVGVLRNIVFMRCVVKGRSTKIWQAVFSVFCIVSGILTWKSPISIMCIFAKTVSTVAYGIKNTLVMKLIAFPTYFAWLYYNLFVTKSYESVVCDIANVSSVILFFIGAYFVPFVAKKLKKAE